MDKVNLTAQAEQVEPQSHPFFLSGWMCVKTLAAPETHHRYNVERALHQSLPRTSISDFRGR
jgi:hypothetical protein